MRSQLCKQLQPRWVANLAVIAGVIGGACVNLAWAAPPAPVTASTVTPAPAAIKEPGPDALLSAATKVVTARLNESKDDRDSSEKNQSTIAELLESTILPLFDFRHMTQHAVARNWKLASAEQQAALIAEFKTLLVRTYYAALVNYRDEVIEYKPLQLAPGDTDVTVKSTVKKPGVERMTIDYDMKKVADGWKVYDIRIAGISLTTNYRAAFSQIISDGGIDELIRFLMNKNRQSRSGLRADASEVRGIILLYGVAPSLLRGHR